MPFIKTQIEREDFDFFGLSGQEEEDRFSLRQKKNSVRTIGLVSASSVGNVDSNDEDPFAFSFRQESQRSTCSGRSTFTFDLADVDGTECVGNINLLSTMLQKGWYG